MKRAWILLAAALTFAAGIGTAEAKEKAPKDPADKAAEMHKLVTEKQAELNGSKWQMTLGSHNAKAKMKEDTFLFQDNQMTSLAYKDLGFGATNYTVTVPEGQEKGKERAYFETMKTGPKGEVVFLKGEWQGKLMQGNITEQIKEGDTREYWFTSAPRVDIPKESKQEDKDGKKEEAKADVKASKSLVSMEEPSEAEELENKEEAPE